MPMVILLELTEPADARLYQVSGEDPEPAGVHLAHAAASDPDTPGDPADTTLRGTATARMLPTHWQPTAPGERWPQRWRPWACRSCDTSLRTAA
ncbi:hypothetical protein [Kitasatospora sp. McL0602]|uniref:hypothetical protein n=1 Tax=Kitasatospora sp. McL0602 TaxID=3439530 RepID=UPI003F8C7EAF